MHHCDMHPSLRRFRESFEVLAQPTAPTQPRKRPFNDPSSWQHLEAMAIPRTPEYTRSRPGSVSSDLVYQRRLILVVIVKVPQPSHSTRTDRMHPDQLLMSVLLRCYALRL